MAVWLSVTSITSRLSACLEQGLRETVTATSNLQIVSFRFEAAQPRWETEKALAVFLKARPDIVGAIAFEPAALRLLETSKRDLRVIFAPADIARWNAPMPPGVRAGLVDELLALKSSANRVAACAPQTTAWSSIAHAIFPAGTVFAPLPTSAPAALPGWDISSELSIGFFDDLNEDGGLLAAAFISRLLEELDDESPPLKVFIPQKSLELRSLEPFGSDPRIDLVSGKPPRDRRDAGGDFVIGLASEFGRLSEDMIWSHRAGATLLAVDYDGSPSTRGVALFDASGAQVQIEEFATNAELRSRLHRDRIKLSTKLLSAATEAWRALLTDPSALTALPQQDALPDLSLLSALIVHAAGTGEETAERQFLATPGTPQAILNAATVLSCRNDLSMWQLIGLALKAAQSSATPVGRPSNLCIDPDLVYVSTQDNPAQASDLRSWLDRLAPTAPVTVRPAKPSARLRSNTGRPGLVAYSAGLSATMPDGQRQISNTGALLLIKTESQLRDCEFIATLGITLAEGSMSPSVRVAVSAGSSATPLTVSIGPGAVRKLQLRCYLGPDSSPEIPVAISPLDLHIGDRLLLIHVDVLPVSEVSQLVSAPEAHNFESLHTCSIEGDLAYGAFDSEYDGAGSPFRWVSQNFALRLPANFRQLCAEAPDSNPPWLLFRLVPRGQSGSGLMSVRLTARGTNGGAPITVSCRRVARSGDERIFGAPVGTGLEDGLIRLSLSAPGSPLSPDDRRIASARLTGAWIARPMAPVSAEEITAITTLDIRDLGQYIDGWHPIATEPMQDKPSRRMFPRAILSSPIEVPQHKKIYLSLSGPVVPDVPASTNLSVSLDGQPMSVKASMRGEKRWVKLFEGCRQEGAIRGPEFEIEAQSNEPTADKAPSTFAVPIHQATIIYPEGIAGAVYGDNRGDAMLVTQSLGWENWDGGLSGTWLPSYAMLIAVRPPNTSRITIEGAAATDEHSVQGLMLHVDDRPVALSGNERNDGSWLKTADIPFESEGAAHLLRVETPGTGRVLLREIQFK